MSTVLASPVAWRGLALATGILFNGAAASEVKEYQIRRMLMLKTECTVIGLDISTRDGNDLFAATCENVSHYPDGVEILCPDTEDERECTILTRKRDFRFLQHLKPSG